MCSSRALKQLHDFVCPLISESVSTGGPKDGPSSGRLTPHGGLSGPALHSQLGAPPPHPPTVSSTPHISLKYDGSNRREHREGIS